MTKLWILKPNYALQEDYRYQRYHEIDELMVFAETEQEARGFANNSCTLGSLSWSAQSNVVGIDVNYSVTDIWLHPHLTTCEEMNTVAGTVWRRE